MQEFDLIVIGGGPGGYLCAERAGKAGLRTALIEKRALGGTCLNEGCIPTKSLLYCAKQYQAALHGAKYGVTAQNVSIDHAQVVARKDGVVKTLVRGVAAARAGVRLQRRDPADPRRAGGIGIRLRHDKPRAAFPFGAAGIARLHRRRCDRAGNGVLFRVHRHEGDGH